MDNKRIYVLCESCKSVNLAQAPKSIKCRNCNATIHTDPRYSTYKSWAFLITAIIAYIPANIYPMLQTKQFFQHENNTIIGGVVELWRHGSYPVAIIVFVASVVIPILKFLILIYLLKSVQYNIGKDSKLSKHKLYYMTEIAGPWSMIDIFVVGILAALIHTQTLQIVPGKAATAFALSVLFTLLSAKAFDKRLIKERKE